MKIKLISLIVISSVISFTHALSIEKGIGVNETNEVKIWDESIPYAIVDQGLDELKDNNDYTVAFFELSEVVYGLSSKLKVTYVNKQDRMLLNHWPLTPWSYRFKMQGEGVSWEVQKGLQGAYSIEKPLGDLDSQVVDDSAYLLNTNHDYLGCFSKTPLRYGDFDNDGQNELVLFLNNDLVVFSPQQGKIMFSATLSYQDELPESQLGIAFGEERDDLIFQYYSMQGGLKPFTAPFAASRSYSKVYVGHFQDKSSYDILVWRKLYHSRLNSDSIKGFQHDADLMIHYQRNASGEYLPQDTSPETIQNWLSSNNLTWQKGFPSKSECAGEEGKLIPEMHDALLNDPDVLK